MKRKTCHGDIMKIIMMYFKQTYFFFCFQNFSLNKRRNSFMFAFMLMFFLQKCILMSKDLFLVKVLIRNTRQKTKELQKLSKVFMKYFSIKWSFSFKINSFIIIH